MTAVSPVCGSAVWVCHPGTKWGGLYSILSTRQPCTGHRLYTSKSFKYLLWWCPGLAEESRYLSLVNCLDALNPCVLLSWSVNRTKGFRSPWLHSEPLAGWSVPVLLQGRENSQSMPWKYCYIQYSKISYLHKKSLKKNSTVWTHPEAMCFKIQILSCSHYSVRTRTRKF